MKIDRQGRFKGCAILILAALREEVVTMKKWNELLVAVAMTVGLSTGAQGQASINDHPGFVDFSTLSGFAGAEPTVQISLKTPLLNMVTNLLKQEDEQAASFISKLMRVNVNVFESGDIDVAEIASSMAVLANELDAQGWERVVRVREDESHVDIYFRLSDDADLIYGIAIMAAEQSETVLVNIVGDISVEDLGALARKFDIDELSEIDIKAEVD